MNGERLIVLRLVGGDYEGLWMVIPSSDLMAARSDEDHVSAVRCVPTGCVEWRDDDACAEVYVPEDRLALWRAEHDVEQVR